ncbi:acetate--CoA ligase family protein [Paralcaligenes sp. KSB-10]|uniref:acetate--CoA ligase family protein n=1 Tax=Paralcaligenes sp. KSB-10 TaxID=2901142 RepID=UPI001E445733|nr:acetate--CoA ligase family protein [Paralcaligenes sp. KSB-10]UHL66057.1 acetate--CoA ligase family protein [Paralcaligenes sp. KSB-10]
MQDTRNNKQASFAKALLEPESIALIGASSNSKKNTARPFRFMRKHGFKGLVFPINATSPEIFGEKSYASVCDVPQNIDHAFIMISSEHVEAALRDCASKSIPVVTIYSDGFGETGPEGQVKQARLLELARSLGIRILGPNSIGVANIQTGGIISVNAAFEMNTLIPGRISLVSQSGSMMGSLLSRAGGRGFGFAKTVSVGNESDISVGEVVDALVDDKQTTVILLFLETLRDTPSLSRALSRARLAGKPVIAYKLGRSAQGDALSQSHTGAIAGNDAAVDAYFDKYGVMRVDMLETLFEMAPLAERYHSARLHTRPSRASRVAVITTTGGGAATVVDNLGLHNIEAVPPPPDFITHMKSRGLALRETPVIDLTLAATGEQYKDLLEQLLQSDWCDAVLSVAGSSAQFHPELVVKPLVDASKPADKPLIAFLAPEAAVSLSLLQQHGIATFRTPEACADALRAFLKPAPHYQDETAEAVAWPDHLPTSGNLNEPEANSLFSLLGIETAQSTLLQGADTAHDVPYPIVLKIVSRDILHKTEAGGVVTGLEDDQALRAALPALVKAVKHHQPDAKIDGMLVQKMESRLIELMLGYRHDPLVGPIIVLSAGGIAAELMPDYATRLAPIGLNDARDMIDEVRHTKLVRGFRGLPQADCGVLAQAIVDFSKLALLPGQPIAEAEINPLFIQAQRVVAVDGVVRLRFNP